MIKNKIKFFLNTFFRRSCYLISIPISLILVLISPFYRVILIGLQAGRIGHYALNTELMLCELDEIGKDKKNKIIFYNMAKPCNDQLYLMWRRIIPIFPIARLAIQLDMIMSRLIKIKYKIDVIKAKYEPCSGALDEKGLLEKHKTPHLYFTQKEKEQGERILEKIGMRPGQPYVCLMVRDSAYLNEAYPDQSWSYHDHRNANVLAYEKAALYLAEKGYMVFRMGKCVNQKFSPSHPNIVDYANSEWRSDFMDIFLSANCFFCISTCTGLDCVSQIFRKHVLMTNISPIFAETLKWYPCTLYIPKLLKNTKTDEFIALSKTAEICKKLSRQILKDLAAMDLVINENHEDEIFAAVSEMELRVKNEWIENDDQKDLQLQYWQHYAEHCPINVEKIHLKIGSEFLNKYSSLMLN